MSESKRTELTGNTPASSSINSFQGTIMTTSTRENIDTPPDAENFTRACYYADIKPFLHLIDSFEDYIFIPSIGVIKITKRDNKLFITSNDPNTGALKRKELDEYGHEIVFMQDTIDRLFENTGANAFEKKLIEDKRQQFERVLSESYDHKVLELQRSENNKLETEREAIRTAARKKVNKESSKLDQTV